LLAFACDELTVWRVDWQLMDGRAMPHAVTAAAINALMP